MELRPIRYHAYTIWLFTRSDLKTIVFPSTFFAVVSHVSGLVLEQCTASSERSLVVQIFLTILWTWINLLPFDIDNQRQPGSIGEDAENKPWRPLPSNRISEANAKLLMISGYLLAFISSCFLGGLLQCLTLIGLGFWYNDLRGADSSCIIRNLINACGYMCFISGALEIIAGRAVSHFEPKTYQWLLIIGAVIFTTIHAQDMSDQPGDRARFRRTVPLVVGDHAARISIVVSIAFWSWFCPLFWKSDVKSWAMLLLLGGIVSCRFLLLRTIKADKISFRLYNLWIISLFLLPLFKGSL